MNFMKIFFFTLVLLYSTQESILADIFPKNFWRYIKIGMKSVIFHQKYMLLSNYIETTTNGLSFPKNNQVKRVRISEMITIWRKFVIKPPNKILQKLLNGLLFEFQTGLHIRKINVYNSKNIFCLNSRE